MIPSYESVITAESQKSVDKWNRFSKNGNFFCEKSDFLKISHNVVT